MEYPVTLETMPVFVRGGYIVPLRTRQRRSSQAMRTDPFTLIVALDEKLTAKGELYVDDGVTFAYENGDRLLVRFEMKNGELEILPDREENTLWIERVVIYGLANLDEKVVENEVGAKNEVECDLNQCRVALKMGLNKRAKWHFK